jgi:hypothetical protein
MEGIGCGLIEILFRHLPGVTKGNYDNPQSG